MHIRAPSAHCLPTGSGRSNGCMLHSKLTVTNVSFALLIQVRLHPLAHSSIEPAFAPAMTSNAGRRHRRGYYVLHGERSTPAGLLTIKPLRLSGKPRLRERCFRLLRLLPSHHHPRKKLSYGTAGLLEAPSSAQFTVMASGSMALVRSLAGWAGPSRF